MISAEGIIAAEWCLFSIALILAAARIAIHVHLRARNLLVSDVWLLIATLDCMGLAICDTLTYRAGAMSDFFRAPLQVRQVRFATNYLFDFGLYFTKFSMLAFYIQLVPYTAPAVRKTLYGLVAFVCCSSLTTLFADTFWCGTNISINWSPDENDCSTFASINLVKINWSLNITSEIFILVLPFPLLRDLRLRHRRDKAGLLVVFLLGFLTITVSFARFIGQAIVLNNNNIAIYILAMTEISVSIIILSLISMRPLLRKIYRVTASRHDNSPFSRSTRGKSKPDRWHTDSVHTSTVRSHGPHTVYHSEISAPNMCSSEVELTKLEPGRIYKTEEVSVTSARGCDTTEDGRSN